MKKTYTFVLNGNIPSKKNRYRFAGKRMYSDAVFTKWHKAAMIQMKSQMIGKFGFEETKMVSISFEFESLRRKDLSNCCESVNDLLVDCGVLADDNFKVVPRLSLYGKYTKGASRTIIEVTI